MRAGYRTRDHEGGQFGYTWGAAEVGAALYAEHSTHCLYSVHRYLLLYASAPAVEQRLIRKIPNRNSYLVHAWVLVRILNLVHVESENRQRLLRRAG